MSSISAGRTTMRSFSPENLVYASMIANKVLLYIVPVWWKLQIEQLQKAATENSREQKRAVSR
jgi:hypothetical protein